ncbi:MAG: preprotein translocase subunit SecA [Bacteroidales bacterium]|nr:preprotein translocase subunit SecA [Candidatus Colimorpha merdihippi]MCQ2282645.1 preprotein translocase subunit SecA [Bacteroidales bacterium]
MANFLSKLFGTKADRDLKEVQPLLNATLKIYPEIQKLSNDELRAKTIEFKERINKEVASEEEELNTLRIRIEEEYDMPIDEKEEIYKRIDKLEKESYDKTQQVLNDILPEAFAVVKETARRFATNSEVVVTATERDRELAVHRENIRIEGDNAIYGNSWTAGGNTITWDMVHYDVQLIGGSVLHSGKIAEMATGEGKTLVATLPVYLNALPGKGVHVVTVNDYLAKRDSEWMGMLYEFHGLKVDCIDKHEPHSEERKAAYRADITFGTNNEFGFDYLRDNMSRNPEELVQRGHNYAIVDEVDSVLIDDARTPLIISGPTGKGDEDQEFDRFKPVIEKLYNAQRVMITKVLAEAKTALASHPDPKPEEEAAKLLLRAYRGLPKNKALIKFLSETGMRAILQRTENFYMQEQNKYMHIIDDELYFTIDEKNRQVELTDKGMDFLTDLGEDRNFYQLPDVGGMIAEVEQSDLSPEEKTARKEKIYSDYAIQSDRVHTVDQLLKAYTLFEKDVDYIVDENHQVKIVDEQTGRIMEGRRWSDGLHQAVEAKENAKVEAATQTYATITLQNYFRMYKKLAGMTGTAETEAGELWDIYKLDVVVIPTNRPIAREDMDDMIYKTKREKYTAVINEVERLIGIGRPVLVGTTNVETSELLSKMLKMRHIEHSVLNAKLHQREADIVAHAGEPGHVTIATNMAGRGTDIKLKGDVKEKGGLAIIGTERHESRRVDRQLRGRAGRQGDPGSSLFFVSLEDDLMRIFGSERIAAIMDRMGLQEGEVIQHSMITKQIEKAQKKVEENNFGMRKRLLEYDDVMNNQRTVIYNKRRNALYGDRLSIDISNMFYDTCALIYDDAIQAHDWEGFKLEMIRVFALEVPFSEKELFNTRRNDAVQKLYDIVFSTYKERMQHISDLAFPFIQRIYENTRYINVAFPITDGKKTLNVVTPVKKSYENKGREVQLSIEKGITLAIIDDLWKEHLRELDELKTSVQNATYEQKDPLLIYKFESFNLFEKMLLEINREISSFLIRASLPVKEDNDMHEARQQKNDNRGIRESRESSTATDTQRAMDRAAQNAGGERPKNMPIRRTEKKIGPNDPCPCGSGKKYKKCCGANLD